MDLGKICEQVRATATIAGAFLVEQQQLVLQADIRFKDTNSLVTYVDETCERLLVEQLSAILPGAAFLTEEGTVGAEEGTWQWIIDPLDGTTNFLHHLPIFSISIALKHEGKLVLGVIYDPVRKEMFYAWEGGGAWLNGQSIRVSATENLKEALVITGFPYHDYNQLDAYLASLKLLMQGTRGIRRLGSAAIDLAYVACGRFDTFYEYHLSAWDIAAGMVLVKEAGGLCSDFHGNPDTLLYLGDIVAGNPVIHREMVALLDPLFQ